MATKKSSDYSDGYTLGEFLYRLHFLAPLNQIGINIGRPFGYTLAGLVSFIFLFALISGLMLHWDKSNPISLSSDPETNGKWYGPICIRPLV
ncbi:PepSY domain-containing protein [Sphingobacterium multivorum]|uniref:PepSY domain-containing protein n=1 Tax=Sphingobacterium multivorum TaxID=28454 RepID=UPI0036825DEB